VCHAGQCESSRGHAAAAVFVSCGGGEARKGRCGERGGEERGVDAQLEGGTEGEVKGVLCGDGTGDEFMEGVGGLAWGAEGEVLE
jgi:hypothetical protein